MEAERVTGRRRRTATTGAGSGMVGAAAAAAAAAAKDGRFDGLSRGCELRDLTKVRRAPTTRGRPGHIYAVLLLVMSSLFAPLGAQGVSLVSAAHRLRRDEPYVYRPTKARHPPAGTGGGSDDPRACWSSKRWISRVSGSAMKS